MLASPLYRLLHSFGDVVAFDVSAIVPATVALLTGVTAAAAVAVAVVAAAAAAVAVVASAASVSIAAVDIAV